MRSIILFMILFLLPSAVLAETFYTSEGTTGTVTMLFTDSNNALIVPDLFRIIIDDANTSIRLYEMENATPTSSVETVVLPVEATRIVNESLPVETHIMSIHFLYTVASVQYSKDTTFDVKVTNDTNVYVDRFIPTALPAGTPTSTPAQFGVTPIAKPTPTPR